MKNVGEKIAVIFLMVCWIPFEYVYRMTLKTVKRPSKVAVFLTNQFITYFARKQ